MTFVHQLGCPGDSSPIASSVYTHGHPRNPPRRNRAHLQSRWKTSSLPCVGPSPEGQVQLAMAGAYQLRSNYPSPEGNDRAFSPRAEKSLMERRTHACHACNHNIYIYIYIPVLPSRGSSGALPLLNPHSHRRLRPSHFVTASPGTLLEDDQPAGCPQMRRRQEAALEVPASRILERRIPVFWEDQIERPMFSLKIASFSSEARHRAVYSCGQLHQIQLSRQGLLCPSESSKLVVTPACRTPEITLVTHIASWVWGAPSAHHLLSTRGSGCHTARPFPVIPPGNLGPRITETSTPCAFFETRSLVQHGNFWGVMMRHVVSVSFHFCRTLFQMGVFFLSVIWLL